MADDHLVQLCSDFYRKEEVETARSLVEQYIGQPSGKPHRMPHRKGSDALRATIDDLLKVILNPNLKLPVCYAKSLKRLPPVDASHCDDAAILLEVQSLRLEVRRSMELRADLDALYNTITKQATDLDGLKCMRDDIKVLKDDVARLQSIQLSGISLPPTTDHYNTNVKSASSVSYSVIAQKLNDTSELSFKTAS